MGANLPIGPCSRNSSPRDPKVISRGWPSSSVAINRSLSRFHSLNTSAVCFCHSVAQSEIDRSSRVELSWHWLTWSSIIEVKLCRRAATCHFILLVISVRSVIYRENVTVTDIQAANQWPSDSAYWSSICHKSLIQLTIYLIDLLLWWGFERNLSQRRPIFFT